VILTIPGKHYVCLQETYSIVMSPRSTLCLPGGNMY